MLRRQHILCIFISARCLMENRLSEKVLGYERPVRALSQHPPAYHPRPFSTTTGAALRTSGPTRTPNPACPGMARRLAHLTEALRGIFGRPVFHSLTSTPPRPIRRHAFVSSILSQSTRLPNTMMRPLDCTQPPYRPTLHVSCLQVNPRPSTRRRHPLWLMSALDMAPK
jgi:hypothetical protein